MNKASVIILMIIKMEKLSHNKRSSNGIFHNKHGDQYKNLNHSIELWNKSFDSYFL